MEFVTKEPASADEQPIINTDFWLNIDVKDMRDTMRIDNSITVPRLRHITLNEIAEVNGELSEWRNEQIERGFNCLADVPAEKIGGISILLFRYKQAIYSRVKSKLLEKYRDVDLTNSGNKKAQDMEDTIDEFLRDAHWAISEIQGKPHTKVYLI